MRYRWNWVVVEPSTAVLCRTSLLTLLTLQFTAAEEDQKKTWMKTGHTPHLQYLLVWKKDPGCTPPFPKPHPCIKGQDSKLFQISQMDLGKNSHSCPRPDIILTCACQGKRGPVRIIYGLDVGKQDGPFFVTVWAWRRVKINRYF